MIKILIAEDDEVIFAELKKLLMRSGYDILDGLDDSNLSKQFDLAILDVGLPGRSGYELCSIIRESSSCPVIFLTSMDKPENELMGFAVGADDYVRKPFNPAVLLARIERLLKQTSPDILTSGELMLDIARLELRYKEQKVPLSKTEFAIMKILFGRGGVISPKEIIEILWDDESFIDENTLYVNINRLREKLKEIGQEKAIRTVRGSGYMLECEP